MKNSFLSFQSGQLVLIVVLSIAVALTVGLSVASRVITNLKISKESEESQRALSAAEAGIQIILEGKTVSGTQPLGNQASFTATEQKLDQAEQLINGGDSIAQDNGIDVWLSSYDIDGVTTFNQRFNGTVTIYFATSDQAFCGRPTNATEQAAVAPALELAILQGAPANPSFLKYVYDPCCSPCRIPGAADALDGAFSIPGGTFSFSHATPPLTITNGLIMKVIPVYNSTKAAVVFVLGAGPPFLPPQGSIITSVGASGQTQRKILYYNSFPQLPIDFFPYSVLSQ